MHSDIWNPWHGCIKYSEGCKHCYVYRRDESIGKDASIVTKTKSFDLAIRKYKNGQYKCPPGSHLYLCMTSDFFIDKADEWRNEIWEMVRTRSDMTFTVITKRIVRFYECIPPDWGDGYDNVAIVSTIENQKQCDIRFPFFNSLPIKAKFIACEPMLEAIDMKKYLNPSIKCVLSGGESGEGARELNYDWVLELRRQCVEKNVPFYFKQTGANFVKDNVRYYIPRKLQGIQAHKAGIDTIKLNF